MKYLIALSVLLSGCATVHESAVPESLYQVLNAVDYAQTVNVARRPDCFREVDPITRRVIGTHPSVSGVLAWGAAESVMHYSISGWLDREVDATDEDSWRAIRAVWHIASLGLSARDVVYGARIGARPFGSGCYRK